MDINQAKNLFRNDLNSYGYVKAPMSKIDKIYNDFNSQICENCNSLEYRTYKNYAKESWHEFKCDKAVTTFNCTHINKPNAVCGGNNFGYTLFERKINETTS